MSAYRQTSFFLKFQVYFYLLAAGFIGFSPLSGEDVNQTEVRIYALKSGGTFSMFTYRGKIIIDTWDSDSVRIMINRYGLSRMERKFRKEIDDIRVNNSIEEDYLVLHQEKPEKKDFGVLDLFKTHPWNEKSGKAEQVDYEITLPAQTKIKVEHSAGNIDVTGVEGSFFIILEEGQCRLNHILYDQCSITLNDGKIVLEQVIGKPDSEIRLQGDACNISAHALYGIKADFRINEGWMRSQNMQVRDLDMELDEGNIEITMISLAQGRYGFSVAEGDVDVRLLNDIPMKVALRTVEGRIETNLDLDIQRSDEGERVRQKMDESTETQLRILVREGDIRFYQE